MLLLYFRLLKCNFRISFLRCRAPMETSSEWARHHVKIRFCCIALLYKLCETIKLLNCNQNVYHHIAGPLHLSK